MATRFDIGRALQGFGAGVAGKGPEFLAGLKKNSEEILVKGAFNARAALLREDNEAALASLNNTLTAMERAGGDTTPIVNALDKFQSGDIAGTLTDMSTLVNFATSKGILGTPAGLTAQERAFDALTAGFTPEEKNKAARVAAGLLPRAQRDRLTPEEAAAIEFAKAKSKKEGQSIAERNQSTINLGVDAAGGIPILRRSLQLLERVETGGIDAGILRAQQLFGIEGANEGELSANLGRAVLSQLKATFGAQFTEKEGDRLERISSRFGASAATNKRLLRQTLTLTTGAVDRALDANPDEATKTQLLDFLEGRFDLTDEALINVFNPSQQAPLTVGTQAPGEGGAPRNTVVDF